MIQAAPQSFDVVADVGDHPVPLVPLRRRRLVVRAAGGAVAVGGGVGDGSHRPAVSAKAIRDDPPPVFHADRLEEVLEVLAVLLRDEGTETSEEEEEEGRELSGGGLSKAGTRTQDPPLPPKPIHGFREKETEGDG